MLEADSEDPTSSVTVGADENGAVSFSTRLELGDGLPTLTVEGIELPSPVRVNAQTVLLDRRLTGTAVDFDGDGRADTVDVAMWREVVGNETLTPPDRGSPLTALRVDTVAAVRVTYSGGSAPATETSRLRTWYAEGIGIVRNAVESAPGSSVFESEDWLLGFDGIERGWGWVRREAIVPPGGVAISQPTTALASADGVLAAAGATVFSLDSNGRLRGTHAMVDGSGSPLTVNRLLRLADGVRAISVGGSQLQMTALADDGRPLAAPTVTSFGSDNPAGWAIDLFTDPQAAPGASRAWAAWTRRETGGSAVEVVLRGVDAAGVFATPEIVVPVQAPLVSVTLQMSPRVGGAIVQWMERAIDGSLSQRLVSVDDSGALLANRRFELGIDANGFTPQLRPVGQGADLWWLWLDRSPTQDAALPHALRVDAVTGVPLGGVLDRATMIAAQVTPIDDDLVASFPSQVHPQRGRWLATGQGFGLLYNDGDGSTRSWLTLAELDPGAGAPALGAVREVFKVRIPVSSAFLPAPPVAFDDRVILLPWDKGQLRPVVVWRR